MSMHTQLAAGFADPVHNSQQAFRAALNALARPGRIQRVVGPAEPVIGLGPAAAGLALALLDFETPVWLDSVSEASAGFLRFHCGCPITQHTAEAVFAFVSANANTPDLESFALGTDDYPESAATLVIEVSGLRDDGPLRLSGPGIQRQHRLGMDGLSMAWLAERDRLRALFPRGLDMFLTCGNLICGLPRTTRIQE